MINNPCLVVLGCPNAGLSVLVPLKCTCIPFFFHSFLELFTCVGHVWDYNGDLVFVVC